MDLVGIVVTVVVAVIVFLVQEIRMKLALRQQRRDLRADFREDLKSIIPMLFETWWKDRESQETTPPEIKAKSAGIAETLSTAWFSGKDIKAIFAGQDFRLDDFQEQHADDKDDDDFILVKEPKGK